MTGNHSKKKRQISHFYILFSLFFLEKRLNGIYTLKEILKHVKAFQDSKIVYGGRQLFADSQFSCIMGNVTLAKREDCIFQVTHNEIM